MTLREGRAMNNTDSFKKRPHYHNGQLLNEKDFLDEQEYNAGARRRHNLYGHGWGVVRGLEVTRKTDNSITVNAGYAIESSGQEVFLDKSEDVDLEGFGPNEKIRVSLKYEENKDAPEKQIRRDCRAVILAAKDSEDSSDLTLATVKLDGQAKLGENAIDYKKTTYVRILKPGSVTSDDLHDDLKRGWLRIPPRPEPLLRVPKDLKFEEIPPPFRVGAITALSPDSRDAGEKDHGAAGTISIPIPPGAIQVTQLRIAGPENEGKIFITIFRGTWDNKNKKYHRDKLADETISTRGAFMETFNIEDTTLDSEWQTLSLRVIGTRRTHISLIAVEFVS